MYDEKRGPGRPAVSDDERATTRGISMKPATLERLRDLAQGSMISAVVEEIVDDATIRRSAQIASGRAPLRGFGPFSGTAADAMLNARPAYTLWRPRRGIVGFEYPCGCEIRGDQSWYVLTPCSKHAKLAASQGPHVFAQIVEEKYVGGYRAPFPIDPHRHVILNTSFVPEAAEAVLRVIVELVDARVLLVRMPDGTERYIPETWVKGNGPLVT